MWCGKTIRVSVQLIIHLILHFEQNCDPDQSSWYEKNEINGHNLFGTHTKTHMEPENSSSDYQTMAFQLVHNNTLT